MFRLFDASYATSLFSRLLSSFASTRRIRKPLHRRHWSAVEELENRTLLSALPFSEFVDPNPNPDNEFGHSVVPLSTGNVVITSPFDDAGGVDAGAVYLFNGATGELISTLTGSSADDGIGKGGVIALPNGNFVVKSIFWDNGSEADAGAVTWGDGITGVSGIVSSLNSLVGSQADDRVGSEIITVLPNGNYVVPSPFWHNDSLPDAGAVTWGDGSTGVSGEVSETNSLVGTHAYDHVGGDGVTVLANGNYVVNSNFWDNDDILDAGAVTWGDGSVGVTGGVSSSNSLVGTRSVEVIGRGGITILTNGNYVVVSPFWSGGDDAYTGAVTWGDGTTGVSGEVNAAKSLVGSNENDRVGSRGVTALTNGNYVVSSPSWDNGAVSNAGAVTWGDGTTGVTGVISGENSLIGSQAGDLSDSSHVSALPNGNFVVVNSHWDNGAIVNAGAATWGDGTTGVSGEVSSAISLVGTQANDLVGRGGVTVLPNGNYVIRSSSWDNESIVDSGAVTWGNGSVGVTGELSSSNSLVGTHMNDSIGSSGISILSNGNYVVRSESWDNGTVLDAGAVTWGNGSTGVTGAVSEINSLVGTHENDQVGHRGATALSNGNYVVYNTLWDNGDVSNVGAVTWGDGTTGVTGPVSELNSLVGSQQNDQVGVGGVTALPNGNYLVHSSNWANGDVQKSGALTWGDGTTGISGAVSEFNSLVGSHENDQVGNQYVTILPNGNYVARTDYWDNGSTVNAGAVTWGDGTIGVSGNVSEANSLVGTQDYDFVGQGGVTALTNGHYVVGSYNWDLGDISDVGAVTWANGSTGIRGAVTPMNSLIGNRKNYQVGNRSSVLPLQNGNYVVKSNHWEDGAMFSEGAATLANGMIGTTGMISEANSLTGITTSQFRSSIIADDFNNTFYARFFEESVGIVRFSSQSSVVAPLEGVLTYNSATGSFYRGESEVESFGVEEIGTWDAAEDWKLFFDDFNGDGSTDVIGYRQAGADAGRWQLGITDPSTGDLMTYNTWQWDSTAGWTDWQVGDFNGDGLDDVAARRDNGQWWAARSTGTGIQSRYLGNWSSTGWVDVNVGDFNNDGKSDLVGLQENGQLWYGIANAAGERIATTYAGKFSNQATSGWRNFLVGDFDDNDRDDIALQQASGQWYFGLTNGPDTGSLGAKRRVIVKGSRWNPTNLSDFHVGDFNGDGIDQITARNLANEWWVQTLDGGVAKTAFFGRWDTDTDWTSVIGDFNGDGKSDIGAVGENGAWQVSYSTGNFFHLDEFGVFNDLIGTTDIATGDLLSHPGG